MSMPGRPPPTGCPEGTRASGIAEPAEHAVRRRPLGVWAALVAIGLTFALVVVAPVDIAAQGVNASALPSSLVGREWSRIPTAKRYIALTFDAGANADAVPSILSTLRARNVRATFFLTGSWARRYPVLSRRITATYPVGNHSDTHPDFTTLTRTQQRGQISRAAQAIAAVGGGDTRPIFRFPFGARNTSTISVINGMGYGSIRWTVDSLGWQGTSGGMTATKVVRRVTDAFQPGAIVLMHVGSHPDDHSMLDAQALNRIITIGRERGYGFVTIRQFLPR